MEWKFIKELKNIESISEFEKIAGVKLSTKYKEFIKEYNGARPSKKAFKTEKKVEHVIKGFLSFNKEDKENIFQVYEWNKNFIDEEEYFAIANDPFGNYIISDKRGKIYYFEHEAGNIEFVADSFEKFIELLYD